MNLNSLFISPPATNRGGVVRDAAGQPVDAAGQPGTPVYITPQSFATFSGAVALITVIWKLLGVLVPQLSAAKWLPIILALLWGGFAYWISISDPANPLLPREKWIGFVIALSNTLVLAAAVLGITA